MSLRDDLTDIDSERLDDWGEPAVWTPQGGSPVNVILDFDDPFFKIPSGAGDVLSSDPSAFGKENDFPGVKQGDNLLRTNTGQNYSIIEPQPDDLGGIVLTLQKA